MSEKFRDLNQNRVDFLLTDLDLAMTFMDVAETSHIEETTHRNRDNARKAHDAVLNLSEKLKPEAGQRQAIDAKLAILKTRLHFFEEGLRLTSELACVTAEAIAIQRDYVERINAGEIISLVRRLWLEEGNLLVNRATEALQTHRQNHGNASYPIPVKC